MRTNSASNVTIGRRHRHRGSARQVYPAGVA